MRPADVLKGLAPDALEQAIAGMDAPSRNGLRNPFAQDGIPQDVRAGMDQLSEDDVTRRG
ncbi:hypothetical protein DM992_34850 [Burkholderia sp. JP2-270]|uniref:hypothetical protein n=1 Tax=Burkholderia sp. JP2-270 TaxID=2217913 RepID=UPI000DA2E555|nr:hypothetical protein [Burkholderia sp. JP2-270]AWV04561.1 hypothetical protein DM992_34850 [Burkholderia sp. JP2-270]